MFGSKKIQGGGEVFFISKCSFKFCSLQFCFMLFPSWLPMKPGSPCTAAAWSRSHSPLTHDRSPHCKRLVATRCLRHQCEPFKAKSGGVWYFGCFYEVLIVWLASQWDCTGKYSSIITPIHLYKVTLSEMDKFVLKFRSLHMDI